MSLFTYEGTFNDCRSFDEAAIKKVHEVCSAFIGDEAENQVRLAGRSIINLDVDSIISNPLVAGNAIRTWEISGEQGKKNIRVSIGFETIISSLRIKIEGDQHDVEKAERELINITQGTIEDYSWLGKFRFGFIRPLHAILFFLLIVLAAGHPKISAFSFLLIVFVIFLLLLLNWTMPLCAFPIGYGKKVYESKRSIRSIVVFGIILASIVGVFGNFATDAIKDQLKLKG